MNNNDLNMGFHCINISQVTMDLSFRGLLMNKHGFSRSNISQVTMDLYKTEAEGRGYQQPRGPWQM